MHLLQRHAAEAVDEHRALVDLVQRIRQVRGHRERTPEPGHVHCVGLRDQLDRVRQVRAVDDLAEVLQGQDVAFDELAQHLRRVADRLAVHVLGEFAHAFAIAQRCGTREQAVAEQALHLRRTIEAERLGEADDRRRLYAGAFGQHGQRFQGHGVGFVQHVAGDLLQPFAQRLVTDQDRRAQFLGGGRWGVRFGHAAAPLGWCLIRLAGGSHCGTESLAVEIPLHYKNERKFHSPEPRKA